MNISVSELDLRIKKFKEQPTRDDYEIIKEWYSSTPYGIDEEYMICIYLFLQGANIKNKYETLSVDEHRELVVQLRDYIERADPLYRNRRKTYLDYGSKSGYYK